MNILVLEASTSSAKAMVYSSEGEILREHSAPYRGREFSVAVQNPQKVLEGLLTVGKEAAEGFPIDGISLGGTWHSLLLADRAGRPKTDCYTWAYTGAADTAARFRQDEGETVRYYHKTGCMTHSTYPFFKWLHLGEEGLSLRPGDQLMTQGAYIYYQLTGQAVESVSMASGSGFLNLHSRTWDGELLERASLGEENFPRLEEHTYTSSLRGDMAGILGLQARIPVIPAHPDGALNQVGSGALGDGVMTLSAGTSGAIRMAFDRPYLPVHPSIWCYCVPGKYLAGAATSGCTNCLDWFAGQVLGGRYSLRELDQMAEASGPDTPVFLPFLFGERCPGWHNSRLGGFLGVKGSHSPGQLYRAILEGALFNLYQCYEVLTREAYSPREIRASGGVMKSPLWLQMLADIFGREITVHPSEQASMLGAAALGLTALGAMDSPERFPVGEGKVICPNPENRVLYQEKYARYRESYARVL